MKKLFLFAAAALGLATAHTTAPVSAPVAEQRGPSADSATVQVPKSASGPAVTKATPRAVDMRIEPRAFTASPRHFHDVARPRRVRYGKSRWIWLS